MRIVIVLLWFILSGILLPATSTANDQLARQGVDQLLRLDFKQAENRFRQLRKARPDYPLLGFLDASVWWVKAEASQGDQRRAAWEQAEKRLMDTIAQTEARLEKEPDNDMVRLNLGMSQFFLGRVQVELSHIISAIRHARAGRDLLRELITRHPDLEDAYFVLGMYEYLAGSVPRGLKWLTYLLDISGDRDLGVRYLARATSRATIMAPEAARMLLAAAAIQPEYVEPCQYLNLSREVVRLYPENPHYSAARQLILVNCGYPKEALAENKRAFDTYLSRFPDITGALNLVRLQVYPAMGAMDEIEKIAPLFRKNDHLHWYLAKAQTYDALGEREKAVRMYRAIEYAADNPNETTEFTETPPDLVVEKALHFLKHPYQRPKPVVPNNNNVLALNDPTKPVQLIEPASAIGW